MFNYRKCMKPNDQNNHTNCHCVTHGRNYSENKWFLFSWKPLEDPWVVPEPHFENQDIRLHVMNEWLCCGVRTKQRKIKVKTNLYFRVFAVGVSRFDDSVPEHLLSCRLYTLYSPYLPQRVVSLRSKRWRSRYKRSGGGRGAWPLGVVTRFV